MSTAYIDLLVWLSFEKVLLDSIADEIAEQEIAKLDPPFDNTDLIISACTEMNINSLNNVIERIIKHNFKTVTILVDWSLRKIYSQLLSDQIINNCKIIPIHWWMVFTAFCLRKRNIIPSKWNWHNKKGLFLTGQLDRYNRIGFLKELYDSNLLDNIMWTFPAPEKQKSNILKYFNNNVPENFSEFFSFCSEYALVDPKENNDIKFISIFSPQGLFIDGYKLTNFSIISETSWNYPTEKIYAAMTFHHPFIILSKPKLIRELKELGFKTFENYLPLKEYVNIEDNKTKLDMVVENIRAFPKVIEDRKEEISIDIQHNYNLLQSLTAEAEKQLMNILPTLPDDIFNGMKPIRDLLGADKHEKYLEQEKILSESDSDSEEKKRKMFVDKYNTIKSDSWPNINDENDFQKLPNHIISECKERFNFSPTLFRNYIDILYK